MSLFIILLSLAASSLAQDERYFRQVLSGTLLQYTQGVPEGIVHQFNVIGPAYHLDLNDDGIEEIIHTQKRDGVDWVEVRDSSQTKIFEAKLPAWGGESVIYKMKYVRISPTAKALIIYLDEGKTEGKKFESTARIFILTYENNDLKSVTLTEGPHYFHEKEGLRGQYYRRDYQVNVYDINNDGVKEIAVQFNHIQRILQYKGKGEWVRY